MSISSPFNPDSPQTQAIFNLFIFVLIIGGVIFSIVSGLVIYIIIRYPPLSEKAYSSRLGLDYWAISLLVLGTLNLLTNDEVLAVNQDELGRQAVTVSESGEGNSLRVYARDLEDGAKAVGLFNLGTVPAKVTARWADLKLSGRLTVRDLWRQNNRGRFESEFSLTVAPHGAEMLRISK